ncbi:MAG: DUF3048 domain-containing protein [Oscillospiraceae bacterium]
MKKIICALLTAVLLSLAACGEVATPVVSGEPSSTPAPVATPTATAEPSAAPYTNPLSGEVIDSDISGVRPWAVMINNLDRALPQCGVSQAEIIYEVPAEGGVTRMMAIFSDISDVKPLGSIRSIRPYYADIGLSYDAIVVHAGGSVASYSEMSNLKVDHLDGVLGPYAEKTFYREPSRIALGMEHSLFTSGDKLMEAAEGVGFTFDHDGGSYDYKLSFSEDAASQCTEKAEYAKITFNGYKSTSFTYDAKTDLYTAFEYGINYVDGNTKDNMTFKNIIVLTAPISVLDDVGRLSVKLTGEGEGYFICGGKYTPITWTRGANDEPFVYHTADGSQLDLGIGSTYIGIMAKTGASLVFEKK